MRFRGKGKWNFWKALEIDGSSENKFIFALLPFILPVTATKHTDDYRNNKHLIPSDFLDP